ncbi:hypothetical protein C8F01DRAFT_1091768 [Mycena amicta]|nr:hypothetical protein C8F01DRAFT_1091768 [Mycena amicta]
MTTRSAGNALPAGSSLASLQLLLRVLVSSLGQPGVTVAAAVQASNLDADTLAALADIVTAQALADSAATNHTDLIASTQVQAQSDVPAQSYLPSAIPTTIFQTGGPWVVGNLYHVVPGGPLQPASGAGVATESRWYSITKGRFVGITPLNELALEAVSGVRENRMVLFSSQAEALAQFNTVLQLGRVAIMS